MTEESFQIQKHLFQQISSTNEKGKKNSVRIVLNFKINLITFKTLNGSGPRYLEDILKFYHQTRTLRSSRDHLRLEEPNFNMKTYGQRAFSVAAPRLWNKLPFEIRACSDVNLFKSKLKTFLFKKVYDI